MERRERNRSEERINERDVKKLYERGVGKEDNY